MDLSTPGLVEWANRLTTSYRALSISRCSSKVASYLWISTYISDNFIHGTSLFFNCTRVSLFVRTEFDIISESYNKKSI